MNAHFVSPLTSEGPLVFLLEANSVSPSGVRFYYGIPAAWGAQWLRTRSWWQDITGDRPDIHKFSARIERETALGTERLRKAEKETP